MKVVFDRAFTVLCCDLKALQGGDHLVIPDDKGP
jgi:hypothetical protein